MKILYQLKTKGNKAKILLSRIPHADHIGGFYAIAKVAPIEHVKHDGIAVDNNMYKNL